MTIEEAAETIYWLIIRSDESEEGCYIYSDEIKALNMAIEALKQPEQKKGKWISEPNCWYRCSYCGSHYPSIIGTIEYNYCPNCGADMKEEKENDI